MAVFAVVFLHVAVLVLDESRIGSQAWWIGNLYDSGVQWAVPLLVMISGALLLDPAKREPLAVFYGKRASRVLRPLLFWSPFFLAWAYLPSVVEGRGPPALVLLKSFLSGRTYYHMWFLYMIIGLYAFVPFIRGMSSNTKERDLFWAVVLMFGIASAAAFDRHLHPATGSTFFPTWFLPYVPYFLAGHLIRQTDYEPPRSFLSAILVGSWLATAAGFYLVSKPSTLEIGVYFHDNMSFTVISMAICVLFLAKSWRRPLVNDVFARDAALLTLGVYLIHPLFRDVIVAGFYRAIGSSPIWSVPLAALSVFAVSLLGSWMISRVPYLRRTI
jgi:surface polysaccharide O-acyltransferase-like enzyme